MAIKFIDIHTHLVPNVDDGSRSIDESIEILKLMINDNITDVILTPHVQSVATTASPEEQRKSFIKLEQKVLELKLNIKLHFGYEVRYISHLRPEYAELTLANSKYILLEFSYSNNPRIEDVIFNIKALNLIPVIAHIERYSYLNEKGITILKKLGAIIQVNAKSIYNPRDKKIKKLITNLLKNELIDIIASDTHNLTDRPNNLRLAYDNIKNKYSNEYLEDIFYNNAKKIINNK